MGLAAASAAAIDSQDWPHENLRYLSGEFDRLRLLARRQLCWVRSRQRVLGGQAAAVSEAPSAADRQSFFEGDSQARQIAASISDCEERVCGLLATLRRRSRPAALDRLVRLFDLDSFERQVLVLCLGVQMDTQLSSLCALIQRGDRTSNVSLDLVLTLLGSEDRLPDAVFSLQPSAPLCLNGLVEVVHLETGETHFRISPRAAGYIQGYNRLDPRFEALLDRLPSARISASQARLAADAAGWVRRQLDAGRWPRVHLDGPPGAGRRAFAGWIFSDLDFAPYSMNMSRLPDGRQDLRPLIKRETSLYPMGLYLEAPTDGGQGPPADFLESIRTVLITAGQGLPPSSHPTASVEVIKPGVDEQLELWTGCLADLGEPGGDLEELTQQLNLGPAKIASVVRHAYTRNAVGRRGDLTATDLAKAAGNLAERAMETQAQALESSFAWEDLVLPAGALDQLKQIVDQASFRHHVYSQWGFHSKMPRGRGVTALFAGPSGTGKTMAAEVLANALGLRIYRVDFSRVVDKYIGETEKNLSRLFDAAEGSGAILFFDEADALFGKRTEVKDSHDRYANIEAGYLLQRIEEQTGVVILATNLRSNLDEAFLRRFRFVVEFPFPGAVERKQIWHRAFPEKTPTGNLDLDLLARFEFSGASIMNVTVRAAFLAAAEGSVVRMDHLLRAAEAELAKEQKLLPGWLKAGSRTQN